MMVMVAPPNFEALIADAYASRKPVPLARARQELGDLFDETDLAYETLVIRGADFALTPTTWVRLVRRAQTKLEGGRGAG